MTTADIAGGIGSRVANPLPLAGDTGATSPRWGIDWLAVTVWGVDVGQVARLVSEAFHFGKQAGVEEWQALGGARFYGQRHEYLGATLLSEYLSRDAEDNAHVVMPGDTCAVGGRCAAATAHAAQDVVGALRGRAPGPGGRWRAVHAR